MLSRADAKMLLARNINVILENNFAQENVKKVIHEKPDSKDESYVAGLKLSKNNIENIVAKKYKLWVMN